MLRHRLYGGFLCSPPEITYTMKKKNNNTRRLTRLLLKIIWFGTVMLGATVAWFVLYAGVASLIKVTPQSGIISAIAFTTIVFLVAIGIYWLIFRKGKITILRWTAKTLLILSPFVILCSFALSALNTVLPLSSTPTTDTSVQQEAVDTPNDLNNAPVSPQDGSQAPYSTPLKPYTASKCSKTVIPYQTEYINDPDMYVGTTFESGMGWDGYKETCTADSNGYKPTDYTSPPYNKKIYIGTKPKPATTPSTPNYSVCNQFVGTGAYEACIRAINSQ